MTPAVVLLSGGIDSTTLLHYARRALGIEAIYALSFDYGQRHSRELKAAEAQAAAVGVSEHRILAFPAFGGLTAGSSVLTDLDSDVPNLADIPESDRRQPPTYVPNRNMVLLALAAAYAEANGVQDVYYGAQAQDEYGYWDCTADFLERINALFALNRRDAITIHAPFVDKRKAEVLRVGLDLGVDYARTWTCYRGGDRPCGRCPSCIERAAAFSEAGHVDPLA